MGFEKRYFPIIIQISPYWLLSFPFRQSHYEQKMYLSDHLLLLSRFELPTLSRKKEFGKCNLSAMEVVW